jgi:hypothetical protein
MFEAGAIAFIPRSGPFARNGLLVFWSPLTLFSAWVGIQSYLVFKALNAQEAAPASAAPIPRTSRPLEIPMSFHRRKELPTCPPK